MKPTINKAIFLIAPPTSPHWEEKDDLIKFFLPTGSRAGFALCHRVHSQLDHWVSAMLPLIDSGGVLTSSPVPLRLYPQFTAMSKGCISVQPSAVQVLERLPGVWEDMQKSKPPRQQISLSSAQQVSLNVSNTPLLRDLRWNQWPRASACCVTANN